MKQFRACIHWRILLYHPPNLSPSLFGADSMRSDSYIQNKSPPTPTSTTGVILQKIIASINRESETTSTDAYGLVPGVDATPGELP